MWKRIGLALGGVVLWSSMAAANQFAEQMCRQELPTGWRCVDVAAGTNWQELVPNAEYRDLIQRYNRQNTSFRYDQQLVVPPFDIDWNSIAPFPQSGYADAYDTIVFDPRNLAWAHYLNGQLIAWGPAVGGKDWCANIGRECRTDVGVFHFTEAANANRRSSAYPIGCHGSGCAPMPRFLRFTDWGQGIHARSMRGANASHGCVGVFEADSVYLSGHVRARVGKSGYGYFTAAQLLASQNTVRFVVLPYE